MGRKSECLIFLMLMIHVISDGQVRSFGNTDTLTYNLYMSGKWDDLIGEGEAAIKSGIDYKFLRQRLGYACFMKGDYFKASAHLEKALGYDTFDQFTIEYLWLSYLYSGKEAYAGTLEKSMFPDLRKRLSVRKFIPISSAVIEYNYKFSGSGFRSNGQYFRAGLGSKIGYRAYLDQSFSAYSQSVSVNFTDSSPFFTIKQPEYYAGLRFNVADKLILGTAYHYINTHLGNSTFNGHLFLLGIAHELNRFLFEANLSVFRYAGTSTWQPELQAGYIFPGRTSFYMKGSVAALLSPGESNIVISPETGFRLFKGLWLEGHAAFGRMNFYNDYNGLYVYNGYDPMIMRMGAGMTYYLNERLAIWLVYSTEKKEYYNYSSNTYNQFSYLGGLKLKI